MECNTGNNGIYDLVIIGGGPAGLTAGLYAARAKMNAVLLERGLAGGQLSSTGVIDNYIGFRNISGAELAQNMEGHATSFGLEIRNCEVKCLNRDMDLFKIDTSGGTIMSRTVIITTGVKPRDLGIPGEKKFRGKGVSYCAICDGFFYRDKHIAVIGGGDSALEEGIYLTKFAGKVSIIHRRDEFRAVKIIQERATENPKIEFIMDTLPVEILGGDYVTGIRLKDKKTDKEYDMDVDGVFIYIGTIPNTFVCGLGLETDEMGYILTNERMQTSMKGLYAAGDVRSKLLRQIVTAVGDGATAAVSAEKDVEEMLYWEKLSQRA